MYTYIYVYIYIYVYMHTCLLTVWKLAYCSKDSLSLKGFMVRMAVSTNMGSFKRGPGLLRRSPGLIQGMFRADPHQKCRTVSMD